VPGPRRAVTGVCCGFIYYIFNLVFSHVIGGALRDCVCAKGVQKLLHSYRALPDTSARFSSLARTQSGPLRAGLKKGQRASRKA